MTLCKILVGPRAEQTPWDVPALTDPTQSQQGNAGISIPGGVYGMWGHGLVLG